jgi:hypothetical protein
MSIESIVELFLLDINSLIKDSNQGIFERLGINENKSILRNFDSIFKFIPIVRQFISYMNEHYHQTVSLELRDFVEFLTGIVVKQTEKSKTSEKSSKPNFVLIGEPYGPLPLTKMDVLVIQTFENKTGMK